MTIRNFEIHSRKVNTRDSFNTQLYELELSKYRQHFVESLDEINALDIIVTQFLAAGNQTQADSLLRAQVLLLASAFDFYMHEATNFCLCQMFGNVWTRTSQFNNLAIRLVDLDDILVEPNNLDWFHTLLMNTRNSETMVSYEQVKKALNTASLNINEVANACFYVQGSTVKTESQLKQFLSRFYEQRNVIAHQSGRDSKTATVRAITQEEVRAYTQKITIIIENIHLQIQLKLLR